MLLTSRGRHRGLIKAGAILLVLISAIVFFLYCLLSSDRIYNGVTIEGLTLSNATREKAFEEIAAHLNGLYGNESLPLMYGSNTWLVRLSDVSYSFLVEEALKKAYEYGRTGNIFKRVKTLVQLLLNPVDIKVETDFNGEKLRQALEDIAKLINSEKADAELSFVDGEIKFKGHVTGMKLNTEKSFEVIKDRLIARDFESVDIVVDITEPDITIDKINEIDGIVSSFSTRFSTAARNRSHNIKVACEKIRGTIIMPGEVFSMDKALGPRTKENGYLEAPVIIRNEMIDDIGGGICQVTTTLYNTALLAGMQIVERTHHSWPLGYVSAGRDATIAEGSIDFKFRNNSDYAMSINAFVNGGTMVIEMWGKTKDRKEKYMIETKVLETYMQPQEKVITDDSLPEGTQIIEVKGRNGRKVAVYRVKTDENGEVLDREVVSIDVYKPVRQVVRISSRDKIPDDEKEEISVEKRID